MKRQKTRDTLILKTNDRKRSVVKVTILAFLAAPVAENNCATGSGRSQKLLDK